MKFSYSSARRFGRAFFLALPAALLLASCQSPSEVTRVGGFVEDRWPGIENAKMIVLAEAFDPEWRVAIEEAFAKALSRRGIDASSAIPDFPDLYSIRPGDLARHIGAAPDRAILLVRAPSIARRQVLEGEKTMSVMLYPGSADWRTEADVLLEAQVFASGYPRSVWGHRSKMTFTNENFDPVTSRYVSEVLNAMSRDNVIARLK